MDREDVKNIIIYIFFGAIFPLLCFVVWQKISPQKNYEKGFQAGLEHAEASCLKFDETTYIGSDEYIKIHDPKLYDELGGSRE